MNSDAAVRYAHPHRIGRWRRDRHRHLHDVAGVFHRVVEQIRQDRSPSESASPLTISGPSSCACSAIDRRSRWCRTSAGSVHSRASSAMSTGARETACGFWLSAPAFSTWSTVVQPLGVGKHDVVELLPPCLVNVSRLQRLQVEPHRRDRGLQLVRDRIDEGLVLFVALDLDARNTV